MKDILGLLFLICVTVVGIYLATTKQIEWKVLSALLIFGLVAGFVISRYDTIKIFQYKDVKLETFQGEVDAITGRALKDVQAEVKAQKESLQLVIADANRTREGLIEQKKFLQDLFDKTKKLEQDVTSQRSELEKTVARSEAAESRIRDLNRATNDLATILVRITWLQAVTKNEFGTERAQASLARIETDLNGVLQIVFPDPSRRSAWVAELNSLLPPRK
jgi:succinate dehydrogenase/fumarate reductase flavoprotein subunit